MQTITIPKELARAGDLVVVPRKEYEQLLGIKKMIPVVKPTPQELRAIRRGEQEFKQGKYVNWDDIKHELAHHRK